jgi:hypothetical protein
VLLLLLLLDTAEGQHSQQQHDTPGSKAGHVKPMLQLSAKSCF